MNSKKMVKYAVYAGVAYLAYKTLEKSGALKGLGDDLTEALPSDVNIPVVPYGYPYGGYNYGAYGYGYPYTNYYGSAYQQPYNYGGYGYGGGYSGAYGGGVLPPILPQGTGFGYENPYGGQSYGGYYNPKVVTPSGGVQGMGCAGCAR